MADNKDELLDTVRKIHGLLELLAEEKIAQRDAKQRSALREIVGTSAGKKRSIFLMDGTRTQAEIQRASSVNQGDLSTMVGRLRKAHLLDNDQKNPALVISIPTTFFDEHD
jgi:hypothetical protein